MARKSKSADSSSGSVRSRPPHPGTGGRWWIWVGRIVLWAFLVVVMVNGIVAPFRTGDAAPQQQEEREDTVFPETAAAAFALRFAHVYLNDPPEQEGEEAGPAKEELLSAFLPDDEADAIGAPEGIDSARIDVLRVQAADDHNGVVTLALDVNGEPMSLDVPVFADDGGSSLVVSGSPALLPAPAKAELPDPADADSDADAREQMEPVLQGFFEAYAQTPEHLARYVEPGIQLQALPADTVIFTALDDVDVPGGDGEVRRVRADVTWELAGGEETPPLEQSYTLTMVDIGGSWYVRDIQGALNSFGS